MMLIVAQGIFNLQELGARAEDFTEFVAKSRGYREAQQFQNKVKVLRVPYAWNL